MRLSELIVRNVAGLTKGVVTRIITDKNVKVDGKRVTKDVTPERGQTVDVFIPSALMPDDIPVIYSDENIVIVDKPKHTESEFAVPKALENRFGKVYPVHRLDINTTGIVVYARNEMARFELEKAFKSHQVRKKYVATAIGKMPSDSGKLKCYLLKDDGRGVVKATDEKVEGSLEAVTEYEVLDYNGELSTVALYPITGRTHQLRVQLAHIGCPILGDSKYGDYAVNKRYNAKEQQLRAVAIRFIRLGGVTRYLSGKEFETENNNEGKE